MPDFTRLPGFGSCVPRPGMELLIQVNALQITASE